MSKHKKIENAHNSSYNDSVERNSSEWRKQRIMSSNGQDISGKSWEENNEKLEKKAVRKKNNLENKIKASKDAGISDDEVKKRINKFSLKRVDRFIDENGVEQVNYKEVKHIVPKQNGKVWYRNQDRAIMPHDSRSISSSYIDSSFDELVDNILELENDRLNKFNDKEKLYWYRNRYQMSINRITSRYIKCIEIETEYPLARIEYIDSILAEKFLEIKVTESEPQGIILTTRGWLRAGARKIIKLLQKI